jgi:hypothetical protein
MHGRRVFDVHFFSNYPQKQLSAYGVYPHPQIDWLDEDFPGKSFSIINSARAAYCATAFADI